MLNEGRIADLQPAHANERLHCGSVTYPILRAVAKSHPGLTILHIDARPDLYGELDGNRHSCARPSARITEEGLASRLVQVGVRTINPLQCEKIERLLQIMAQAQP